MSEPISSGQPSASESVAICGWFVADSGDEATFFPQIGLLSSDTKSKEVYWRCIACFYASSKIVNPEQPHIFFTNTDIPVVDGFDIEKLFKDLDVEVIRFPISYRIMRDDIKSWGNQFYILDIIKYIAKNGTYDKYVVLDTDCLLLRPITDMSRAIDKYGALTYYLGEDIYAASQSINGCTRQQMAEFAEIFTKTKKPSIPYFGGEIFAASLAEIRLIADLIDPVWNEITVAGNRLIKEEAHFLSVIYDIRGYASGTANGFIKRMWTTFKHRNVSPQDVDLMVWHLPSEKKTGFLDLYSVLKDALDAGQDYHSKFTKEFYKSIMGIPKKNPAKLARDLYEKIREKTVASIS